MSNEIEARNKRMERFLIENIDGLEGFFADLFSLLSEEVDADMENSSLPDEVQYNAWMRKGLLNLRARVGRKLDDARDIQTEIRKHGRSFNDLE